MGRITARKPVLRIVVGGDSRRRADVVAVEEPLEIRVGGSVLTVTMRTPGHDVELAAGFLVAEGVIGTAGDLRAAIHCAGPDDVAPGVGGAAVGAASAENTYNVLDIALAPGLAAGALAAARHFATTSSCGVCGSASIEAIEKVSRFRVADDPVTIDVAALAELPDRLRAQQSAFDKTGGIHAAGLFDVASGETLVVREDVGRHNAVDKVIGWALLQDRLPLTGTVLQVSGRTSFELVQKAVMAGIPILAAVSAPSSLAVELAAASDLTLVGFSRGESLNVYAAPHRITTAPYPAA